MNFWKYVLNVNNNMDDFNHDKLNEQTKEDIQNSSQNNAPDENQNKNSNDQLSKSDQRKSNHNENIKDSQDNSNEKNVANTNEQVNDNDHSSSQNNEADESQNKNSNDQLNKSDQRKSNQNENIKDSQDNSNEKDVTNINEQVNDNDQSTSQNNALDENQNKNSNDQLSKSAQRKSNQNEKIGDSQDSKDNSNEKDISNTNEQVNDNDQNSSQNNAPEENQNKISNNQLNKSNQSESDKNEKIGDSQDSQDNSNEKDVTNINEQVNDNDQRSNKNNDNLNQKDSKKEFKYKRKRNVNKIKNDSKRVDNFTYYQQNDKKTRTYLDLQELRDKLKKLEEIAKSKKMQRYKVNVNKEKVERKEDLKPQISDETNNFLKILGELPSFENRDSGDGYSIDTESNTIVSNTIIKTLINKFLNQRFCKKTSDLNIRTNSLEKSNGFYKWEVKDVIKHLKTHEVTKVLTDKYGYEYAEGKNENVPLSFYFDMSGSMSEFTNMLATIAIELLRKNVKVLIGFNQTVNVQIESIDTLISVKELADVLESGGYYNHDNYFIKNEHVKYKFIHEYLDSYLINKKCEKCVVFSDFDPISNVINLSNYAKVYWFCFENNFTRYDLKKFNGFIYKVKTLKDLENGLIKVNQKRFETLVFTDNPENIRKKVIR